MKNYSRNQSFVSFLYIISMIIAFTTRYGDILISKYVQLSIGAFWILYVFLTMAINRFNFNSKYRRDIPWMLRSYLVPSIVLHLWTILLMIIEILSWDYVTSNASVYIPTLLAISSIYLFGEKAFKYNFIALVSSYVLSVLSSAILVGSRIFLYAIMDAYFDTRGILGLSVNYLELHDTVLAIGFVLIYFIFSNEKLTKRNLILIVSTLMIMTLGLKRVSVLGVILAVIFHKVVKGLPENKQYKWCRFAGLVALICCYIFVWVFIEGTGFWDIIAEFGINPRGRSYYWTALAGRCEFSPEFLGLGRNYSYILFGGELSYMRVGAAHCDILKMYAENGFMFFAYWLWHYLLRMTKRYKKRFSMNSALIYFGITIYLFTLYLTDNVEVYFASIIFSIVIPVCHALKNDRGEILSI